MAWFEYLAFKSTGQQVKGRIEAPTVADVRAQLETTDLLVAEVRPVQTGALLGRGGSKRHAPIQLTHFFSDLAILMNAGLGIEQALRAMKEASNKPSEKAEISRVVNQISAGSPPSVAIASIHGVTEDMAALILSGEHSGRLPFVMNAISLKIERRAKQRKQLLDASIYPVFLILMMLFSLGIITFVLVPTIEPVFESSGRQAPFIVYFLSYVRHSMSSLPVLTAIFSTTSLIIALGISRPETIKRMATHTLLRTPVIGQVLKNSALSQYLFIFSLLIRNNVHILTAINISAKTTNFDQYKEKLTFLSSSVAEGRKFSAALKDTNIFPSNIVSILSVGEEVNNLPDVMEKASDVLSAEAQRSANRLLALMTPMITIILGLLVGGLMSSVMTALLRVNELGAQ